MDNFNYDSYCGIYCGACDIMMAYKTGKKHKLASFWNESTVKSFQHKMGIPYDGNEPYEVKCHGCKSGTLFVNCRVCEMRKCAVDKKVEHCTDCGEYPCDRIKEFGKAEKILPHVRENVNNLEAIRKGGVDRWLSDQEERWRCPQCKTGFSWYTASCAGCGEDLRKSAFPFSFLGAMIFKLAIHLPFGVWKKQGRA